MPPKGKLIEDDGPKIYITVECTSARLFDTVKIALYVSAGITFNNKWFT